MANKGTPFEREIATKLSLWWTGGERSDIFWRTGGSGGRARVRGRKGKQTQNQHGDIFSVDPIGKPFTDLFVTELKRGYGRNSIQDLLDKPDGKPKKDSWAEWIVKAHECCELSEIPYWLLIVKRDRRETLVFFLEELWDPSLLGQWGGSISADYWHPDGYWLEIRGVLLEDFLKSMTPKKVGSILDRKRDRFKL